MPALPTPPARPGTAYRLGFFGPDQPPDAAMEAQMAALLRRIARRLIRAARGRTPLLRLVLPAGQAGAEALLRLARQELAALPIALRVDAILPHPGAAPPGGAAAAQEWPMESLILDGDPAEPGRTRRALGRMVMRNCDLLLVAWDGASGMGDGREGELLRFAARHGPAALWLRPQVPPVLLRDSAAYFRREDGAPRGARALHLLGTEILRALIPPRAHPPHPHGLLESALLRACPGLARRDPYAVFLEETDHRGGGLWAAYGFARNLAGRAAGDWRPLTRPLVLVGLLLAWAVVAVLLAPGVWAVHLAGVGAIALTWLTHRWRNPPWAEPPPGPDDYWRRAYHTPDRLSIAYANRHRSSYVLVILLGALALIFAAIGIAIAENEDWKLAAQVLLLLKFAALICMIGFVAANIRGRWHQKWIAYRLLAELCRKQEALTRLGWSLPVFELRRATGDQMPDADWVTWHFNALLRAAPLPRLDLSTAGKAAIRDAIIGQGDTGLLVGQIRYHEGREAKSNRAAGTWALWGERAFVATVAIVAAKPFLKDWGIWLAVLAAVLPAISAAFFALRQYSEEKLMAEQSARMRQAMEEARQTMLAIPLGQPLSSQDLAAETYEIAMRMLADVAGWAQLVRVKVVEAG
ncbi:MAG: hypothetical protein INF90_19500 [Roseomonas sp.]|nr:hypothetical protein [Roseomonas sp.]